MIKNRKRIKIFLMLNISFLLIGELNYGLCQDKRVDISKMLYKLGVECYEKGDVECAIDRFKKSLLTNPDNKDAKRFLEEIYSRANLNSDISLDKEQESITPLPEETVSYQDSSKENNISSSQMSITQSSAVSTQLNQQVSEKESELQKLKQELQAKEEGVISYKDQIDKLQQMNTDYQQRLTQLNQQISEKESELQKLKQELQQQKNNLTRKEAELIQQKEIFDKNAINSEQQINKLKQQISQYETIMKETNEKISAEKDQVCKLKKQLEQERIDKREQLKAKEQIQQLKKEISDYKIQLDRFNQKYILKDNQINELTQQLKNEQERLQNKEKEFSEEIQKKQDEIKSLQEQVQKLEKKIALMKKVARDPWVGIRQRLKKEMPELSNLNQTKEFFNPEFE